MLLYLSVFSLCVVVCRALAVKQNLGVPGTWSVSSASDHAAG